MQIGRGRGNGARVTKVGASDSRSPFTANDIREIRDSGSVFFLGYLFAPSPLNSPMEATEKRKFAGDDGDASNTPKRRVMGPSMPPSTSAQPEHDRALSGTDGSDSESDDDFGPSLPPPAGVMVAPVETAQPASSAPEKKENKRDDWMMAPPDGSDWASKIDPTQIRKLDSSWVETPEERMRRLGDAVMGVGAPSSDKQPKASSTARDQSMEERIKKYNSGKKSRLESSEARKEEDDDPSARAFDREKDMAVASKISNAKRREMVSKASDYSSRFTKGNYL
ncbi:uncharacterized protein N7477_001199 [Penicillium maclennaniae]|uniref:uncharacterized protein n=1 Tax=Penicillium maclennaniae TaxID=1343394 RepID=UPI002540AA70|nr:uncharacterized protein N7477_001199 [Penicillium maclennaniae]KAJ5684854.1 hypothetical protein N7477_001199 [Penicillium maclennaniae]